ncbi:N-ethylmaleimide reductase [Lewinella aquimaris]|uniref:N-ethylmaleimide reductase n=1 Tax=Neolewinella aquimaris TaxID=1835722 RepID=A0A840E429_9BACT|nr:alkene reductase [Neolewinella aquimaris]MBB4079830.1 N-ethylmaleimide reductase [Neolewinella aquimaris]
MLNHLLSEYQLGNTTLKNRVVMAPLTRSRAEGNVPNSLMTTYYANRATAGLIITEGTSPSFNGLGYPRIPGNFSTEQAEGWKKVTEAVHEDGGKIFLQLMHCGRVSHPDNLPAGGRVLAPSPVEMTETQMYVDGKGMLDIPVAQEMSIDDITFAVKEYATSAKLAIDAGFDGIELHAANGYLLEQFIHPKTNLRTDQFGGSVENRLRFIRNVTEATVAAIGADRVGMRISPYGYFNEMGEFDSVDETFTTLAEMMNEIGIAYLHLVDHEAMGAPAVPQSIKTQLRETFKRTIILSGGYTAQDADSDIGAGKGDLVAFGRPFIANPDLVERFREQAELNIPDQDTFYTPGPEGYITYPTLAETV